MRGLLKRNLHVVAKVFATLGLGRIGPSAAEQILENAATAKDLAEDIEGIMEAAASEAAGTPIKGGMAVSVVSGALLLIAENFVSFAEFFELFLGGFIARILVRVIFYGQLAASF